MPSQSHYDDPKIRWAAEVGEEKRACFPKIHQRSAHFLLLLLALLRVQGGTDGTPIVFLVLNMAPCTHLEAIFISTKDDKLPWSKAPALSPSYGMVRSAPAWPCQMYIRHGPKRRRERERLEIDHQWWERERGRERERDMKLWLKKYTHWHNSRGRLSVRLSSKWCIAAAKCFRARSLWRCGFVGWAGARRLLTKFRIRTWRAQGNHMHTSNV